jgi:hypothetical protein
MLVFGMGFYLYGHKNLSPMPGKCFLALGVNPSLSLVGKSIQILGSNMLKANQA